MSQNIVRALTYLLTMIGLALMIVGGTMWWRQSRIEAALLNQEGRVLLAVNGSGQPATLPDFEAREGGEQLPPTPTSASLPTSTARASSPPRDTKEVAAPPTPAPDPFPPAAAVPARVTAPAIGLDTAVVEMGWVVRQDASGNSYSEWVVPDFAAGWHKNSTLPGHGGNTVLSAHHNIAGEVFREVVNLEPGNDLYLEADGRTYHYRVEEKYILKERGEPLEVRMENNRFIEATPDERLTLVSCWPYETNTHRVVVVARPVLDLPALDAGAGSE